MKYRPSGLANSHIFLVAIETEGVMNQLQAVDLVSEIGRRISFVTKDTRERDHVLFQRLSVAL